MSLAALQAAGAAIGVRDVHVDHDWSLGQDARAVRGPAPLNPWREMDYHFYPVMVRWTRSDGLRRLAWLEPEIDEASRRPRMDNHSMGQRFFDLIRKDMEAPA